MENEEESLAGKVLGRLGFNGGQSDGVGASGTAESENQRTIEPAKTPVLLDTPLGAVTLGEGGRKLLMGAAAMLILMVLTGRR